MDCDRFLVFRFLVLVFALIPLRTSPLSCYAKRENLMCLDRITEQLDKLYNTDFYFLTILRKMGYYEIYKPRFYLTDVY